MKIAYIVNYPVNVLDGVIQKILDQKKTWEGMGHEVSLYSLGSVSYPVIEVKQFKKNGLFSRFICNRDFQKEILSFNPDMVYFRFVTYNKSLSWLTKAYKSFAEINTDDLQELKNIARQRRNIIPWVKYLFGKFTRDHILKKTTGLVSVTEEIKNSNGFRKYSNKIIVVPNSIDLSNTPVIKEKIESGRTGLFFIGSPNQPWQGIEVIQEMAKELKEFDFHIVGWKGLNTENVYYYGYLQKEEYLRILTKCSVCLGTMGLSQKNMKEACPLKVREYLSRGFPVVIGYVDTAFKEVREKKYILEIEPQIKIDYPRIRAFVNQMKDYVVSHEEIKNYIDTAVLEKNRLDFFESSVEKKL